MGLAEGWVYDLEVDHRGTLWIAGSSGLFYVDGPEANRPRLARHARVGAAGACLEEDSRGYLYNCTGFGIRRLDPSRQHVIEYGMSNGFRVSVYAAAEDRTGSMWFGTQDGVFRLDPSPDDHPVAPEAIIDGVSFAGAPYPLARFGVTSTPSITVGPTDNRVDIQFAAAANVQFQYRLDGIHDDWEPPTSRRFVSFAGLQPGRYVFRVRTVQADGELSPSVAVVPFTIRPPYWRTWWFLGLVGLSITGSRILGTPNPAAAASRG